MDMHKYSNLKKFIGRYVEYSEVEFENLLPIIKCVCLKRNEIFIAEGEVANKIAFVNKGYLRVFYNIDAEEVTRDITPLHSFATALPSFITQTPSYEIISAITDCELFVIDKQDLESLYNAFPKWERLGRRVIEDMFVDVQRRLYLFITETAEVRYKLFLKRYPDMIHDVPLKYIADYLGVKIQSLSRLRKSIEW